MICLLVLCSEMTFRNVEIETTLFINLLEKVNSMATMENIMEGGDGLDIFLPGQSPIFHFSYQEITDFGNGGQGNIYFPEKMEDMMLTHESNFEESTIEVFSELTDRLGLKINELCDEIGLTDNGFWAQRAENDDDFYNLRDLSNLDFKGYVNGIVEGFMV